MAPPAWVQFDRDDFEQADAISAQQAQDFEQRDDAITDRTIDLAFAERGNLTTTYDTVWGLVFFPPEFATFFPINVDTLEFVFDYRHASGGPEILVQITITGASTSVSGTYESNVDGPAATITYQQGKITLSLNADHVGTNPDVKIEFKQVILDAVNAVFIKALGNMSPVYLA